MLTLTVEKRLPAQEGGKGSAPAKGGSAFGGKSARALRRTGSIPGVVYGARYESTPVSISASAFEKIFREAGEAALVSLSGLGEPVPTLIHDVDLDPLTNRPRHVDFYAVTKGEKVEVAIPLVFVGASPAVETGANLVKVLHELEIKADPMNLPHHIEVDVALLAAIGDRINAKDLALPKGAELITPPEEVVALVQEVVEEKEEEIAPPADLSAIEVEKKGKEEEAAPEAAAPAPEEKPAKEKKEK